MFHVGDIKSGISRAITEGKLVACLVREDDNEESRIWEEEWLGQNNAQETSGENHKSAVGDLLATKAVVLRITFGSKEAAFLNAFCPGNVAPTFLVIHNARVLEKVEAGVEKTVFMERVSRALGFDASLVGVAERQEIQEEEESAQEREETAGSSFISRHSEPQEEHPDREAAQTIVSQEFAQQSSTPSTESRTASDLREASPTSTESTRNGSATVNTLFPDRAQRLEAEKAKKEADEKVERAARAKARRQEAEEAHAAHRGTGNGKAGATTAKEKARRDWVLEQKQRKDEAKKDRERILAQIEADKQERRARSQRGTEPAREPLPAAKEALSRRRAGAAGTCSLLIRLFDGSSIKGRFEPSATLATSVRDWINEKVVGQGDAGAADVPFTFRQIIPPLPSRAIEVSEEHQTLADLGLVPNATLVLLPVSGYTNAYSGGNRGYVGTALYATYGLFGTAADLVSSLVASIPGFGGAAMPLVQPTTTPRPEPGERSDGSPSGANIKVKTLADQRTEAASQIDQQAEFYNGNSSAFEGRKDEDEEGRTG